MTTTPMQEVTTDENITCLAIESTNKEPAAFVLQVSTEHFRRDQTHQARVEIELPRNHYRRLASEKGLRELRRILLQGQLQHLAGRLSIDAKKHLNAGNTFRYFIVFALDAD